MSKGRIYISGPITGIDDYMTKFAIIENDLKWDGYESVVNPAKVNANLPKDFTHEDYMRVSFAELECCDAIFMMRGWENSKGAQMEHTYAKNRCYTVIYEGEQ